MVLRVLPDASCLSRPKGGSVAGSHHFLGHEDDDEFLNHPISNHSTRIPVVCSFVAEAEYAGVFAAARIAVDEHQILTNMDHPQPATTIFCDNEVAIGLAKNTVTPEMFKSLDMRFHCCGAGFSRVNFASSSSLVFKTWADFLLRLCGISPSLSGPIHCIR
jgi:hypothetical protein